MAAEFFSSLLGGAASAAISAGAQAALQEQAYRQSLDMQQRSFQHDADMLERQVAATQSLRTQWAAYQRGSLMAAGYSEADATRISLSGTPTTLLDWNGPRQAALGARQTTSFSGGFTAVLPRSSSKPQVPIAGSASSVSTWLSNIEPYAPGALQTVWVTPPGSTSTSVYAPSVRSSRSSVSNSSGLSYTSSFNQGWFNTDRMPLFANLGRRF
uniref:VP2 n=7 Tax=Norovirus GIII TaxID=340017 RepID=A0A3G6V4A5_NORV